MRNFLRRLLSLFHKEPPIDEYDYGKTERISRVTAHSFTVFMMHTNGVIVINELFIPLNPLKFVDRIIVRKFKPNIIKDYTVVSLEIKKEKEG